MKSPSEKIFCWTGERWRSHSTNTTDYGHAMLTTLLDSNLKCAGQILQPITFWKSSKIWVLITKKLANIQPN